MSEIEELVTASLRGRVADEPDGEVDGVVLLERARTRGRAYRRRRRAWAGVGLVAASVVTAGAVLVGVPGWTGGTGTAIGSRPGERPGTALPEAAAEPGAATAPARVGTDPRLLHFDASAITSVARHYTWSSGEGYEQLEAGVGKESLIHLAIGPDLAVLDAVLRQGGPGVVVREQPVPGLWLRAEATDERLARQVADAVELGRAQRMALPFQLTALPDDTRPVAAYVGFIDGRYVHGGIILRRGPDATMEAQAQYTVRGSNRSDRANHVIGDREAYLYPGQDEMELLGLPDLELTVRTGKAYRGFGVPDADVVLAGVRVATKVERMSTWPTGIIG